MELVITFVIGLALWGACVAVAKLFADLSAASMVRATKTFAVAWFLISVGHMWVGVTQTGRSPRDELFVFAAMFVPPVAVAAGVLWWRLRRRPRSGRGGANGN
jgi:uncharacterized membrane protein